MRRVDAKGLTAEEIQEAIDSMLRNKDKSLTELYREMEDGYLQLAELSPEFAKRMLECIKQHHPDLLRQCDKV
ncbi:MAG: hypothetical protein HPY74_19890 [Firmicutes bacterium]|nr:hypothetical protein [Bacillota bacterium]